MTQAQVRVVVVDDDENLRHLIRVTLSLHGGFDVIAEAGTGREAIYIAQREKPDVVILDLGLPDVPGRDVLTQLLAGSPDVRVVVFSGTEPTPTEDELRARGAAGYVLKGGELDHLIRVLENLGVPGDTTASVTLSSEPESVRAARRFADQHCRTWGCEELLLEKAVLLISELVTNAILHAQGSCELRLRLTSHAVRVEVLDESGTAPDPQLAGVEDEHGRGLLLVTALSDAWGVEPMERGKVVWAELRRN